MLGASILMLFSVSAFATDEPGPFGLVLNKMSYEDVLNQLNQKSWQFNEYERKDFSGLRRILCSEAKAHFCKLSPICR